MIIYGEFLFLENFITGLLLLILTAALMSKGVSKLRIFAGAILCGAASFEIFLAAVGPAAIAFRILAAVLIVYIGLGAENIKALLRETLLFLALTLISGGAVMALMLWHQIPSLSGTGVFYIPPVTYLRLLCFGIIAFGFSYKVVCIIKDLRLKNLLCGTAEVRIGGETLSFSAMIDSGNYLKEPISGRPVVLIGSKAAQKLKGFIGDERYVIIPFSGAGVRKGILEGIRSDCVNFRGNEVKSVVLAFYDGEFEDSDMILGRDFLDRGISDSESDLGVKRRKSSRCGVRSERERI